jgi:pimeloyl-ACP methyl ester carboxylesterase
LEEPIEYIDIDGTRLEVSWHGPPPEDAPTIVFLHEGLGCVSMWRDFPSKLSAATGCGAFVYSRRGYGRSDRCSLPRGIRFMHEEGLRVLPELLGTAGIRECIIVGHSDGGSIAIIFAGGTSAEPVKALITEAAHVFCEKITLQSIQKARERYLTGELRLLLKKYHGENTDCAFWGWNDTWLHPEFVHWNIESYLPGIRVPLLALQGENDEYGTVDQIDVIKRLACGETEAAILADCGHAPHLQKEALTLETMKRFVLRVLKEAV